MDNYVDIAVLGTEDRFAIGQPVPRSEDPVLLRGEGHCSDDFNLPGQAYAVIVRSPMAHGLIHKIETSVARAMPGVLAVYTAADLEKGGIGPLPARQVMNNRDGTPMLQPVRHALATDKVRYVGEAVAAVIAETFAQAKDAAEAVEVDIEALPAVTEPSAATAPGAPRRYDDVLENVGHDFHFGDSAAVAEAFARAAHVTKLELRSNRIVVNPIEPRAALAEYDPARRHFTLHVGCQGVFGFRNYIAGVLGVGRDEVRIMTDRVGGSFGMKQANMAEYFCLLHAARELRRLPAGLNVADIYDGPPSAFPNGCHIAEIEVDPETGIVDVVKYTFVNDFGVVINPLLVDGQAHGGIIQGIGQALRECTVYDEQGQLLTGSYMDYAMPRAEDAPLFMHDFHCVPATTNPLGAKGCGEAGCAGALPSVMNALVDAVAELGIRHIDMPATPERVWRAIRSSHGQR